MPKREDEFWAGRKESQGRALCPFCGSSNISYNKRFESWRCNKCEKSFPTPSYGPGGDFGKEARWFGKTTADIRRKESLEVAKKRIRRKRYRNTAISRELPSWVAPGIIIFVFLIFGIVIWGFWGNQIAYFFSSFSMTPQAVVSQTPPESPPPEVIIPEEVVPVPLPSPPEISEKPTLRNPSWEELKSFLWEDKTDQLEYIYPTFVCADFARTLQANAKKAGWRCAMVSVSLEGYPDWYDYGIPSNTGHCLNAFETTDRGLVYIDCTNTPGGGAWGSADTIIDVKIGKEYIPQSVFPQPGYWESMGTILEIEYVRW